MSMPQHRALQMRQAMKSHPHPSREVTENHNNVCESCEIGAGTGSARVVVNVIFGQTHGAMSCTGYSVDDQLQICCQALDSAREIHAVPTLNVARYRADPKTYLEVLG